MSAQVRCCPLRCGAHWRATGAQSAAGPVLQRAGAWCATFSVLSMQAPERRGNVQAWVRAEDARELRSLAKENHRSAAGELRIALRKHLNDSASPGVTR